MLPANNEIRFEPTTICNYYCAFCRTAELARAADILKPAFFREILDKILAETKQYNTLTFTGMGEPLLNRDIEVMTQYAVSRGMRVLVVTNGSLLKPARFKLLQDAGVYSIRISFHGATREGYHRLVGRDMFEQARENVYAAAKARKTTKLILTWAQIDGVNDDEPRKWLDMFAGCADIYEIWRAHNWADAFHFRPEQEKKIRTCGRLDRGPLQIQIDGTLVPCCFDYDGVNQYGDLKTQTLAEAFNSPAWRRIKACHESGDFAGSGLNCEHCDQRFGDKSRVLIYTSADVENAERIRQMNTTYAIFSG